MTAPAQQIREIIRAHYEAPRRAGLVGYLKEKWSIFWCRRAIRRITRRYGLDPNYVTAIALQEHIDSDGGSPRR